MLTATRSKFTICFSLDSKNGVFGRRGKMLRRAILIVPLLAFAVASSADGQAGPSKESAVSQMREIVEAIRQCPETLSSIPEEGAMSKQLQPLVLEWDVVTSDSLRAPFQGFVRFKIVSRLEETDEARRSKELDHKYQVFVGLSRGRDFVEYRFEFVVGSEPPELRRALLFFPGLDTDFRAYDPSPNGSCWDRIAKSPGADGKEKVSSDAAGEPAGTASSNEMQQHASGLHPTPAVVPRAKVVTFAWADSGGVYLGSPKWADDWVRKNAKKFPALRFSRAPISGAENYLVVLSTSTSILSGFQAVVRLATTTSTADVSGRGTVTDNYGSTWSYTLRGNVTTTTTTMTRQDVPYTFETRTLYASAYGGPLNLLVARNSEWTSRQEGGDPNEALGTNLGGLARRIRMKTRLLDGVAKAIAELP